MWIIPVSYTHLGAICDYYEQLDTRIKCVHTTNQGQSAARNYGFQFSTGKYIGYVDSDDYILSLIHISFSDEI